MEVYVLTDLWTSGTSLFLLMRPFHISIYAADAVLVDCLLNFWAASVHGYAILLSVCLCPSLFAVHFVLAMLPCKLLKLINIHNIHNSWASQPISVAIDGIQGVLFDVSQSLPGVFEWLSFLSSFFWLSWSCSFLFPTFCSLIRSWVFRSSFPMAEGGCEKFPDHWDP